MILIGVGVFLWRNSGSKVSSAKEPEVSSAYKETIKEKGEASQASSAAPTTESTLASKQVEDSTEPILFRDNPNRRSIPRGRVPRNTSPVAGAPSSPEALRSSELWTDQSWKIWKGVSAVPSKDYPAGEAQPLGSVGNFVLIEKSSIASDEHQFSSSMPLAVFNSEGNLPGLVTGIFAVKLQDASDFESFVLDHDLKLTAAFPDISVFYVTASKEPFDLPLLQETLRKDPRVEKATLEIVTQAYAKK